MPPQVENDANMYQNRISDKNIAAMAATGSGYTEHDVKPVKKLGYGDMGTVFLAVVRSTNEPVALKVINKKIVEERGSGYRVQRERNILASLRHPFLPSLKAHFETENYIYFVMTYCLGGDLNSLRQKQADKRFSESAASFYAAEVLLALEYLHRHGIMYRDLKPENVLIQEDGHIMLTDFDLSLKVKSKQPEVLKKTESIKRSSSRRSVPSFSCTSAKACEVIPASTRKVDSKRVFPSASEVKSKKKVSDDRSNAQTNNFLRHHSNSFVGTEEYVAPEVIWGSGHGMAVDFWTFGVFLYELLYGVTPFKGKSRRDTFYNIISKDPVFPGPSSPATDLISKLLVRDSNKRLGSKGGAEEIKAHPFFRNVKWDSLHLVSRPPFLPSPLNLEDLQKELLVDDHVKQRMSGHVVDPKTFGSKKAFIEERSLCPSFVSSDMGSSGLTDVFSEKRHDSSMEASPSRRPEEEIEEVFEGF